jgi:hypothetical protein
MTPSNLIAILTLAVQSGPEFITTLLALLKQETVTIEDIQKLFDNVKPYEAYGIPDVAPTAPVEPAPVVEPVPTPVDPAPPAVA